MKRKRFVLTDLNHLAATHVSTLRDPWSRPMLWKRCSIEMFF